MTAALTTCAGWPVRPEWAAEAIAHPALDFGVRGGMSPAARKAARLAQRAQNR